MYSKKRTHNTVGKKQADDDKIIGDKRRKSSSERLPSLCRSVAPKEKVQEREAVSTERTCKVHRTLENGKRRSAQKPGRATMHKEKVWRKKDDCMPGF